MGIPEISAGAYRVGRHLVVLLLLVGCSQPIVDVTTPSSLPPPTPEPPLCHGSESEQVVVNCNESEHCDHSPSFWEAFALLTLAFENDGGPSPTPQVVLPPEPECPRPCESVATCCPESSPDVDLPEVAEELLLHLQRDAGTAQVFRRILEVDTNQILGVVLDYLSLIVTIVLGAVTLLGGFVFAFFRGSIRRQIETGVEEEFVQALVVSDLSTAYGVYHLAENLRTLTESPSQIVAHLEMAQEVLERCRQRAKDVSRPSVDLERSELRARNSLAYVLALKDLVRSSQLAEDRRSEFLRLSNSRATALALSRDFLEPLNIETDPAKRLDFAETFLFVRWVYLGSSGDAQSLPAWQEITSRVRRTRFRVELVDMYRAELVERTEKNSPTVEETKALLQAVRLDASSTD